jgi:hypothetical protein
MFKPTFLLASQRPYSPETSISQSHFARLRDIEAELQKEPKKEEEAPGSSSDQTPSEHSSREESKGDQQNSVFDFSKLGEEVGTKSTVEAVLKVTEDDYWLA